jgi:hypothetical protein
MKKIRRRRPIKRTNYRLSDQDKEILNLMYYEGYHPIEMAEAMKISDKTAYKFCSDRFSPSSGWTRGAPSFEERDLIMQRHSLGVGIAMLASAHRRPAWVINRIVNPKPVGIAAIEGAPVNPISIGSSKAPEGTMEKIGRFFRRLFGGSN